MAGAPGNQASFAFAKQTAKNAPNTTYTDRLPFVGGNIQPSREIGNLQETDSNRDQGVAYLQSYGVEGSPETYVRDASIHHILESVLGTLGTSGSTNYTHTITPANSLSYYSFYREVGGLLFEQFTDCKVSELNVSAEAGQPLTATLDLMGRNAQRLTAQSTNTNEVQSIATTGTPTGGTFTLSYGGQTTAAIPYDESAANIATALIALSNVGAGDFVGSGGPLPSACVMTAGAAFASKGVLPITADYSGLTGGTAPTVTVSTTTQGATTLPSLASDAVYNFNDAAVTLGGSATALVQSFDMTISNNVKPQQTDDAQMYDVVEGTREVSLGFRAIFEDAQQYALFNYGSTSGLDQSSTLATTSAVFTFGKGAVNSISFTLPSIAYKEYPVEPDAGGDPIVVDVSAVANRGASPVVTAVVKNQVAS